MVLKQLGPGPELVHCHATLTLEAFMTSAVTSVGVGGAGQYRGKQVQLVNSWCQIFLNIPLAGRIPIPGELMLP